MVEKTANKVRIVKERLKIAQRHRKSYADNQRRDLEFVVGDRVFLRMPPWRGIMRFSKRGKLNPRYVGPYEIVERIGTTAYRLMLLPELSRLHNVFHVSMLWKYVSDPSHALRSQPIELKEDWPYIEEPVQILDRRD
ncbi:uncharacterized protein LOC130789727 [Actinidia eriantha]|uniref:uncharacterized protein LOC130789727 n=1 Tax=Actinidia eriantha TaxID=165200 RepID=UPI00258BBA45|nr:uncharacterized protein LOC130789727 [Actinidia eriantha]